MGLLSREEWDMERREIEKKDKGKLPLLDLSGFKHSEYSQG